MILRLFQIKYDENVATALLAGINLDTNNYTLNTNAETYYMSYYLASLGASAKKVQYLQIHRRGETLSTCRTGMS